MTAHSINPFLNPVAQPARPSTTHSSPRPSCVETLHDNTSCLQEVARIRRVADGAAFCAAPNRGSDQRRSGTQDVNDPVSGPATRPQGPSGSFTSWVPRVAVIEHISGESRTTFLASRGANVCGRQAAF
jgi:hypothetical protein